MARQPSSQPHPIKQLTNRHGMTLLILNDGTIKGILLFDFTQNLYFYTNNFETFLHYANNCNELFRRPY